MCPWVGSHAPTCGRQLWELPSRVEYLSPQGVLLPRVYGRIPSALWLELRGPAAWQAAPSWAVCWQACHQLLPWLRVTFAIVPDAACGQWPWSTAPATGPVGWLGCPNASDPGGVDHCVLSPCRPRCVCVCGAPDVLAPVHRCARPLCFLRSVCRHVALVHQCVRLVWCVCAGGGFAPPPPLFFACCIFVFFVNGKGGACALQAQAWATDAAVQ